MYAHTRALYLYLLSWTHCNILQHTAAHCNTLQHTATHCITLQHTHCNTLTAIYCNEICAHTRAHHLFLVSQTYCTTLQHTATYCNTMQHTATHMQHTCNTHATHCNTLQHTATRYVHIQERSTSSFFLGPRCAEGTAPPPAPTAPPAEVLKSQLPTQMDYAKTHKIIFENLCKWCRH